MCYCLRYDQLLHTQIYIYKYAVFFEAIVVHMLEG